MYLSHNFRENSSRGFGYGTRDQLYKKEPTPGPGAFDCEKSETWKSKTGGGWTFGGAKKADDEEKQGGVGPGEYDPRLINISRQFKLTGRKKEKVMIDSNTGPGSYDLPDTKNKLGTRIGPPK